VKQLRLVDVVVFHGEREVVVLGVVGLVDEHGVGVVLVVEVDALL
jgi:hypothetical protein